MRQLPVALLIVFLMPVQLGAERVLVAAASSLGPVARELSDVYFRQRGIEVRVTFGSSGSLCSQIQNGAPFNVLLSADRFYPDELWRSGHSAGGAPVVYALGGLVIWAADGSPVDPAPLGLDALRSPLVRKIAIANPKLAPYGRATLEVLERQEWFPEVKQRLILGENVAQAAQFVEARAAELGILATSVVLGPQLKGRGKMWPIPPSLHQPIEHAALALRTDGGALDRCSLEFVDWLTGDLARAILERSGFMHPRKETGQ